MFGICGKGTIIFNLPNGISKCIGNVLYVLKLTKQLLLISQLIEQIFKVKFEMTKCWLKFPINLNKWFNLEINGFKSKKERWRLVKFLNMCKTI
jgi:hypothetical protein